MARELHTETEIASPPDRVWRILTDFDAMSDWNPSMTIKLEGDGPLQPGARLRVAGRHPEGIPATFRPRVLVAAPGRELRWLGHLLVPGLFDGEHAFLIELLDGGRTRFVQRETFRGVLVPALGLVGLFGKTRRGFEAMNRALKARAEQPPDAGEA